MLIVFFFKQKTAYELRISDWSSACALPIFNGQVQAGKLKVEERNKLLKSMTDEVAGLVLTDNYRQNQALSLMERMSVSRLGSKQHFIQTLESQGLLDRKHEDRPSDTEIAARTPRVLRATPTKLAHRLC